jgi:hypothetical protein
MVEFREVLVEPFWNSLVYWEALVGEWACSLNLFLELRRD